MNKLLLSFFVLVSLNFGLKSLSQSGSNLPQGEVFSYPVSAKQYPVIQKNIPHSSLLKADFTQTKKLVGVSRQLVSSGMFVFRANKGFIWQINKPFADTFIFGTKNLYQLDEKGKAKVVSSSKHPIFKQLSKAFNAAFEGKFIDLERNFQIYHRPGSANKLWVIGLKPKTKLLNEVIAEMVIVGKADVQQIAYRDKNGDYTQIDFVNTRSNPSLSKEEEAYFAL